MNFKHLDDTTNKLNLSITKIEEEDDDQIKIIPLSSPMKFRSPNQGYRSSSYNKVSDGFVVNPNDFNAAPRATSVNLSVANIKNLSKSHEDHADIAQQHAQHHETPNPRKSSLLSLKSLSLSLRLLKGRGKGDSNENIEASTLETIEETSRRSVFKLDLFERNLKKFVSRSNEVDFQTYSEYTQQQQLVKSRPRTYFKNQKVYARRSSMSDIHDNGQKNLQSGITYSTANVKHEVKKEKAEHKSSKVDKTAEMLKEVRKRNLETAKRVAAPPRRISTAY